MRSACAARVLRYEPVRADLAHLERNLAGFHNVTACCDVVAGEPGALHAIECCDLLEIDRRAQRVRDPVRIRRSHSGAHRRLLRLAARARRGLHAAEAVIEGVSGERESR